MKISKLKVLKSGARYYLGYQYWDNTQEYWRPYTRMSDYFKTRSQAEAYLIKINSPA